jgi:hypothetical protein
MTSCIRNEEREKGGTKDPLQVEDVEGWSMSAMGMGLVRLPQGTSSAEPAVE